MDIRSPCFLFISKHVISLILIALECALTHEDVVCCVTHYSIGQVILMKYLLVMSLERIEIII